MTHLLLGSIGVLAETSDLQRQSFNQAFAEAGLDWQWSAEEYAQMLRHSGGRDRIEAYAKARQQNVDADAIHARKSAIFQEKLADGVPLRPGVGDAMAEARGRGAKLALVSTTSAANIDALLAALDLDRTAFDLVLDSDTVSENKPAPEAYLVALDRLGIATDSAVAVEDNPDGLASAVAAGLRCYAVPGLLHDAANFDAAIAVQDVLKIDVADTAA